MAHAFHQALRELLRVVVSRERQVAARLGVSPTQSQALHQFSLRGFLSVNELAARLSVGKSTASRVAGGMESRGLLARTRDPSDARVVRLVMTPEGRRLQGRLGEESVAALSELLRPFDPEVRAAAIRILTRLAAAGATQVDDSRAATGRGA